MILEHRKIEIENKVIFENLVANAPENFSYPVENEACFVYVRQGQNTAYTANEVVEVPEGNLAFANSGNLIFKVEPSTNTGFYEATIIHISRDLVLDSFSRTFPDTIPAKDPQVSQDMVTGKPCVIVNNYIEGLLNYFDNPHMLTPGIVRLKVMEIVLLMLQSKKADQVARLLENFVNRRSASFKETVENHLFHNVTITEMAHLCHMSLSTFKRQFKKVFGGSPSEYIFQRKLEKSKKLLATSELTMLDVALQSGFKNLSHYSRKFKETYGFPPSQYKLIRSDK